MSGLPFPKSRAADLHFFHRHVRRNTRQVHVSEVKDGRSAADPKRFPTTRVSLVLAAGENTTPQSQQALATLCGIYWYPIYAYLRRQGYPADQAEDFTQGFFTLLLDKHYLRQFERDRGRFRSFLLGCLKHYLSHEQRWRHARKRGGGHNLLPLESTFQDAERRYSREPREESTPEKIFERQWAMTLLGSVHARLEQEAANSPKAAQFQVLKPLLTGAAEDLRYGRCAAELGMSEGAVKVAVHRLRQRFRECLREEIAQTVAAEDEIDGEIRYLMAALRS
jgi:RNA polymerase sigma factor (sigma-70 family)